MEIISMTRWGALGCAALLLAACGGESMAGTGGDASSSAGDAESGSGSAPSSMTAPDTADSNSGNSNPTDPTDPTDPSNPTDPTNPTNPTDPTKGDDSSGSSSGTTGSEGENVVRFIAMGDGGEGNASQYAVADIVEQVCAQRGCEFVLYLGDNFYDVGVDSAMDVQFTDKFEMPYADLDLPFYITLGNHDYGTLGNEWIKSQYQIEYTEYSDKWTLPNEWYSFTAGHVTFVSLDSAQLFWNNNFGPQVEFLQGVLGASEGQYTIAFGHHPFISNGAHGNAGNYEGLSFIPIVNGENVEEFFTGRDAWQGACGLVDIYFSGHDHNRQWHPVPGNCDTHFIVSGAAAKVTDFEHHDDNAPPLFEDDQTPGFAWVEIDGSTMTLAFYDQNSDTPNFEHSIELGG